MTLAETKPASNGKAHAYLGVLEAKRGNLAAAKGHFQRALEINPSDPPPTQSPDKVCKISEPTNNKTTNEARPQTNEVDRKARFEIHTP